MDTQPINSTNHNDMSYICKQFLHDIQAPVSAMHAIINCLDQAPEELVSCYQMALDRITEMLKDLKSHLVVGNSTESLQYIDLFPIIEQIILEKRLSGKCSDQTKVVLRNNKDSNSTTALVQASHFKRIISNLLNNAIEALQSQLGEIMIDVESIQSNLIIRIVDNGCGIPTEILHKVTECHFTHGKSDGSGLGLFHAKRLVESWGGKFSISSQACSSGTCVEITLCSVPFITHAQSPT